MKCPKCGNQWNTEIRSNRQNDSYWPTCVVPFAEHLKEKGYTENDVHELFKLECNYYIKEIVDRKGNVELKKIPRSTTKLKKGEFSEYMSRCRQYASEHGCYLKEPGE